MGHKIRSHIRNGEIYLKNTGSYHEVNGFNGLSQKPLNKFIKDEGHSQKNLCIPGPSSAAAQTFKAVMKELNW